MRAGGRLRPGHQRQCRTGRRRGRTDTPQAMDRHAQPHPAGSRTLACRVEHTDVPHPLTALCPAHVAAGHTRGGMVRTQFLCQCHHTAAPWLSRHGPAGGHRHRRCLPLQRHCALPPSGLRARHRPAPSLFRVRCHDHHIRVGRPTSGGACQEPHHRCPAHTHLAQPPHRDGHR